MKQLTLVNPNGGYTRRMDEQRIPIRRVAGLSGATVVLFDNNKPNVAPLLDEVAELLRQEHGVARVARLGKLAAALPAPEDVLDKVAQYDLAVNAVGD